MATEADIEAVVPALKRIKVASSNNEQKLVQCADNLVGSKSMASFVVYSSYLKQSERDLHILEKPEAPGQAGVVMGNELEMYVRRDYDPYTFALIPYSSVPYEDGEKCGNGCAPLQMAITQE